MGRVEDYIQARIQAEGCLHMTLLDPEKPGKGFHEIAREAEAAGTAAIMVGGSTIASGIQMEEAVKKIKSAVKIPIIIFPSNLTSLTGEADAIWFMSLLNSFNTYYIIDAQAIGAPVVKKLKIESLPMGYIIVGQGGAAGYVGQAKGIPYDHPELAVAYASAAELLGMRYIYLEAGSGAQKPVPPKMITAVRSFCKGTLLVGGGIREPKSAVNAKESGAQIIVTGTIVEETSLIREKIGDIVSAIC